jgi:hypothetical protein
MEAMLPQHVKDVTEIARDRLCSSPYTSIRSLSCNFDNGVLLLRGRLHSFYHKQVAQETVRRLSGVMRIVNEIEVVNVV